VHFEEVAILKKKRFPFSFLTFIIFFVITRLVKSFLIKIEVSSSSFSFYKLLFGKVHTTLNYKITLLSNAFYFKNKSKSLINTFF
jgi:hypothetical protein